MLKSPNIRKREVRDGKRREDNIKKNKKKDRKKAKPDRRETREGAAQPPLHWFGGLRPCTCSGGYAPPPPIFTYYLPMESALHLLWGVPAD